MNAPGTYLTSLAQSLSTMMLYPREHPTWSRAVDASYEHLKQLQLENPTPHFSFIGRDVVYMQSPMHELKDWPWAQKLAEVGVQRLEFEAEVSRESYEEFIADVLSRIVQSTAAGSIATQVRSEAGRHTIRFGTIAMAERGGQDGGDEGGTEEEPPPEPGSGIAYDLDAETGAATHIFEQVSADAAVPLVEADATVRALTVAMKGSSAMIVPLLRLKASDPYNAIHAINVSVLVMALAEHFGLGGKDVHDFGMAGLLHDLGMARVPKELVSKPFELTGVERQIVERHPVDGARMILQSDRRMELAATVSYEHHLRPDGSGYPQGIFHRPLHFASKIVRVCSVYNALRIERAHRTAYTAAEALLFIDERAGPDFDPEVAVAFSKMMRKLEPQIRSVERAERLTTPTSVMTAIPAGSGEY